MNGSHDHKCEFCELKFTEDYELDDHLEENHEKEIKAKADAEEKERKMRELKCNLCNHVALNKVSFERPEEQNSYERF